MRIVLVVVFYVGLKCAVYDVSPSTAVVMICG